MATVKLFAPAGSGGSIQTAFSGTVFVQSDGTVTVDARDVANLVQLGYEFAITRHAVYVTPCMPIAAAAAVTVASATISNGTLSIAAQPDVPRQLQTIINPGTTAITAGNLALTYTANDGTTQVDNSSLIMAAGAAAGTITATFTTSKGVEHLTSAIVTGLVGGTTPGIQVGVNAVIALPLDPRFVDLVVTKETKMAITATSGVSTGTDEAVGSVIASGGLITTTSAPNAALYFALHYTWVMPG